MWLNKTEVLMNLPHVADVRDHSQVELAGEPDSR